MLVVQANDGGSAGIDHCSAFVVQRKGSAVALVVAEVTSTWLRSRWMIASARSIIRRTFIISWAGEDAIEDGSATMNAEHAAPPSDVTDR